MTEMNNKSVKEILEMLEGCKVLAVFTKEVVKDGAVNLSDFPKLISLVNEFGTLSAALSGLKEIPHEAKDMDKEEAKLIVDKVFEIIEAVKA
jgi:hypothetical protein